MDAANIGTIFLEQEVIKTEVNSIIEHLIDYDFMIKMNSFRISFSRDLTYIPNFYMGFRHS